MRLLPLVLALFVPVSVSALPANVEKVETYAGVEQYRLKSNGMTLLLVPNHASPVFTFLVVYHVGSRNESPGNTGSAHLLEHMIFNKSTENFGKANGHPTFQEVLYEAGADYGSTNMTTWNDRMTGYSTLPKDKLDLAMRIEADRLTRGLILDSERQPEMSVVRNEYEIGENDPSTALGKAVVATAIVAHPYHWDTIGYRSDIEGVSTDTLRRHYKTFFWPDNADAVLVGDFDPEPALALFDREFGAFPRSTAPIPRVITVEPPQEGERRVVVRRPGSLSLVQIGYVRPGALHPDFVPLDVLVSVLGQGINSRLYRALVETGLASRVDFENIPFRDPYLARFEATVAPGKTSQDVEGALKAALAQVAKDGITEDELRRAQQQLEVQVVQQRDGTYALAQQLGEAIASADWHWFYDYVPRMKAVTAADVKRVASTYLTPDHATVGWFVPEAGAAPAAATQAAVPAAPPARVGASVVGSAAVPAKAPAGSSFAARTVHRVLPNGLVVDVVENHAVPTVAIRASLWAGDDADPSHPALSRLMADMLTRGTATRSKEEIAKRLDDVGATRRYTSTALELQVVAGGMARDLPVLLDVLGDELRSPAFKADELEKSRQEVKAAVLRAADSTGTRAVERVGQLVYPIGHPFRAAGADPVLADLARAGAEDLRAFHRDRVGGANMVLAIVGDVDAKATLAAVEKALGSLPKGERLKLEAAPTTTSAPTREVVRMPGKANMNLVLGAASGLRRTDPDYEATLVANAVLGQSSLASRLGKKVRDDLGLSYALGSSLSLTDALDGVFLINVNVAPQNLAKAMAATRDVVAQYAKEGATDTEVATQKSYFAGRYQVGLATNDGVAASLVTAERFGYGPRYLDEFPDRVRKVTTTEVNAALKTHLHADALHLVVAGDLEALPE